MFLNDINRGVAEVFHSVELVSVQMLHMIPDGGHQANCHIHLK